MIYKRSGGSWVPITSSSSGGDVRDVVLASDVSSFDSTNYVTIPTLEITDGASGQVWICSYNIHCVASGPTFPFSDIVIRFRSGSSGLIQNSTHVVNGRWSGINILATSPGSTNNNFNRVAPIRYPAAGNTLSGTFGGIQSSGETIITGEFRVAINGSGLTNQTIGLEFAQKSTDATNPAKVLAGSYATLARAQ